MAGMAVPVGTAEAAGIHPAAARVVLAAMEETQPVKEGMAALAVPEVVQATVLVAPVAMAATMARRADFQAVGAKGAAASPLARTEVTAALPEVCERSELTIQVRNGKSVGGR